MCLYFDACFLPVWIITTGKSVLTFKRSKILMEHIETIYSSYFELYFFCMCSVIIRSRTKDKTHSKYITCLVVHHTYSLFGWYHFQLQKPCLYWLTRRGYFWVTWEIWRIHFNTLLVSGYLLFRWHCSLRFYLSQVVSGTFQFFEFFFWCELQSNGISHICSLVSQL